MNTPLTPQKCAINSSYCKFGSEALLKRLHDFQAGIDGVTRNEDVECVHKTRVASRRLRATLPLFRFCFPEKTYKKSLKKIKKVTRLLGSARDLDVQIIFITQYMKRLGSPEKVYVDLLLEDLKDRRNSIQKTVAKGLEKLKASDALCNLRGFCEQTVAEQLSVIFDQSNVLKKAHWHISFRLEDFLSLQEYVYLENEKLNHHQMRIYAKKLRYTMETFAPLYNNQLTDEIQTIRAFQDVLGEMHDYDVWMECVPKFIESYKAVQNEETKFDGQEFEQTLSSFLAYLEKKRKDAYSQFIHLWAESKQTDFFNKLAKATEDGAAILPQETTNQAQTDLLTGNREIMVNTSESFSKGHWPDTEHYSQVTRLALELFDGLVDVHHLNADERCLLECAAILHDIGLSKNCASHHKVGAEIILNDTQLPFTFQERQVIAAIVRYHRKGLPKQKHSIIASLDPVTMYKVNALAGLLRIADSLDYTHGSIIKRLNVKESSKRITVECESEVKALLEEQAFNKKKDLFEKVFNKKLVLVWKQT